MDKTCEFCKKEFSTVSNLRAHLKSSKKCISSRVIEDEENSINNFDCEYCNKEFSTKYNLTTHLSTCKIKQKQTQDTIKNEEQKEINDMKEELKKIKEQNENLKKRIDDIKDENNKLKESVIEMKTEIRIKDEIIQRNDDQISELIKLTTTTNNTMNNNITIYAQIDQLKPMNEFEDELFEESEIIEKACMQTTLEPICSHISNKIANYAYLADATRGKFHYREMIDGKPVRHISASLFPKLVNIFKDDRMSKIANNARDKVYSINVPTDDEWESTILGQKICTTDIIWNTTDVLSKKNEIHTDISSLIQKKTSKKCKKLLK